MTDKQGVSFFGHKKSLTETDKLLSKLTLQPNDMKMPLVTIKQKLARYTMPGNEQGNSLQSSPKNQKLKGAKSNAIGVKE